MRRAHFPLGCILVFAAITPVVAQSIPERFIVREGRMTGLAESPPVTILLDTETGRSWILGAIDGSPQWLPLAFGERVPDRVLPPPLPE
jgi:hypothetical protein